ncbi:uncharacterized protein HD556DRAFT_1313376 [Suillus plorans]|uniref:Uncharacterized protein n=1 Tax=Suillus plorans TaxID=116603 RepID=A0A9P7DBI5_9AGAM|nr:uncharacterized protein HD556DRAFT_1313376 [Suillus plorans]KAG1786624.1 hypothetical protein HD556DRAFT_1313376 [Suillus plorans]
MSPFAPPPPPFAPALAHTPPPPPPMTTTLRPMPPAPCANAQRTPASAGMTRCLPFTVFGARRSQFGQPGAGKGKVLLAVDSELELVHKLIPATAKHTTIFGDAATRAGALEALQQDPKQPYNSYFVMRDERSQAHDPL